MHSHRTGWIWFEAGHSILKPVSPICPPGLFQSYCFIMNFKIWVHRSVFTLSECQISNIYNFAQMSSYTLNDGPFNLGGGRVMTWLGKQTIFFTTKAKTNNFVWHNKEQTIFFYSHPGKKQFIFSLFPKKRPWYASVTVNPHCYWLQLAGILYLVAFILYCWHSDPSWVIFQTLPDNLWVSWAFLGRDIVLFPKCLFQEGIWNVLMLISMCDVNEESPA